MKKFLFTFLLFAAIAVSGVYLFSGALIESLSRQALRYLAANGAAFGVQISRPSIVRARFVPPNEISWSRVSFAVQAAEKGAFQDHRELSLEIDKISLRFVDFTKGQFILEARGAHAFFDHFKGTSVESSDQFREELKADALEIQFAVNFLELAKTAPQIRAVVSDLAELVTDAKSSLLTQFSATSSFWINQKKFTADIFMIRKGQESALVMSLDDLRLISKVLQEKLTESEIDLLSRNPVKAPRLLKIRDYAQTAAKEEHQRDSNVPEDAYRHVLWSYLLTQAYGEEFARQVTDAHEIGDVEGEIEADHKMDFNNNTLGRRYALQGVTESSIKDRVLHDPEIIRSTVGL